MLARLFAPCLYNMHKMHWCFMRAKAGCLFGISINLNRPRETCSVRCIGLVKPTSTGKFLNGLAFGRKANHHNDHGSESQLNRRKTGSMAPDIQRPLCPLWNIRRVQSFDMPCFFLLSTYKIKLRPPTQAYQYSSLHGPARDSFPCSLLGPQGSPRIRAVWSKLQSLG